MNSKSNLISGIILIILIAGYTFGINPIRQENKQLKAEIEAINIEEEALKANLDNLNKLDDDLPTDEVNRKKLEALAPVGLNQSELLSSLNDIANKNGITLHAVNFDRQGEDETIKGLQKASISANFTGVYSDLLNFLNGIELSQRAFSVKAINLQRNQDSIIFSLHIEAYYQ